MMMILNKKYMFLKPGAEIGQAFRFSSELEKVGLEWDVSIRNGTYVHLISTVEEIESSKYGKLSLIKIRANVSVDYHTIIEEFWVPLDCIVEIP